MPTPRSAATLVTLLAVLAGPVAGCTARSDRPPPAPGPTPATGTLQLDASVAQFRFDEGTHRLSAGVTNQGDRPVLVSRATIEWPAMLFPTVRLYAAGHALPGQTAAFTIRYGTPVCGHPTATAPTLVAVVDGRPLRLPLRVEDPGLLRRLHASACATRRLRAAVSVRLRLAPATVRVDGDEYLPGTVVIRHLPGSRARVRLTDLGGSVLLVLRPRAGPTALPGRLLPGRDELRFPVLLGSAHRCDPHARGQSSQTFLISAYVRLEDRPQQRVVLPLSRAERDRAIAVVDRDCR